MERKHTLFLNETWRIDGYRMPSGPTMRAGKLELRISSAHGWPAKEFGCMDASVQGYPDATALFWGIEGAPHNSKPPVYIQRECERMLGLRNGRKTDAILSDLHGII